MSLSTYKSVLLIDDNCSLNLSHKQLIQEYGFADNVIQCKSGPEALQYLMTEDLSRLPEIIFLNIKMPGMNGFDFLEEFKMLGLQITGKCKVIMLSSSESFHELNRANKNKLVRKFLNKPLTAPVLAAINI